MVTATWSSGFQISADENWELAGDEQTFRRLNFHHHHRRHHHHHHHHHHQQHHRHQDYHQHHRHHHQRRLRRHHHHLNHHHSQPPPPPPCRHHHQHSKQLHLHLHQHHDHYCSRQWKQNDRDNEGLNRHISGEEAHDDIRPTNQCIFAPLEVLQDAPRVFEGGVVGGWWERMSFLSYLKCPRNRVSEFSWPRNEFQFFSEDLNDHLLWLWLKWVFKKTTCERTNERTNPTQSSLSLRLHRLRNEGFTTQTPTYRCFVYGSRWSPLRGVRKCGTWRWRASDCN